MKLSVYYESNRKKYYTWLETGDEDLSIMIERDYQERLAKAEAGEVVERRDPQTILDEEISKPTYQTEKRRHASFDKLDENGGLLCDSAISRPTGHTGEKQVKGHGFLTRQRTVEDVVFETEEAELDAALAAMPEDQRNLLLDVYADEIDQRVIANREGVSDSAITHRKERALARLRREMEKIQKNFD